MTNSIGSLPTGPSANETANQTQAGAAAKQAGAAQAAATPQAESPAAPPSAARASEAVTLSADAQITAQLLDAARAADGVDHARVSALRNAVQSGGYGVSPEDLAKSLAGSFITGAQQGTAGGAS